MTSAAGCARRLRERLPLVASLPGFEDPGRLLRQGRSDAAAAAEDAVAPNAWGTVSLSSFQQARGGILTFVATGLLRAEADDRLELIRDTLAAGAASGCYTAAHLAGLMYQHGLPRPPDLRRAERLLEMAWTGGDRQAHADYGSFLVAHVPHKRALGETILARLAPK
jgi:hypothetical protein